MYLSASCVGSLSRSFLSTFLSCLLWSLSELVMSPLVFLSLHQVLLRDTRPTCQGYSLTS